MSARDELLKSAAKPTAEALRLHPRYKGKIQVLPKCPIRDLSDLAVWYSPGVAGPCRAIQSDPELVYEHTNKGNSIAVVSDGTRVLGLGNIGPEASLPVMEGKALLFKYLGGVDAVPLCLDIRGEADFIRTVRGLAPSFGGINLEDIEQPKCFRILDSLRETMPIPVWHDDQQGTATVLVAGLTNALRVARKDISNTRIAMIGMGAANVASYRLLKAIGVDPRTIVACDSKGILHQRRRDIEDARATLADKWRVCLETNGENVTGGIAEALRGADVCIAFTASGPGIIDPKWVKGMTKDAVVFACANPVPEIWPWEAEEAGAVIVATGRGDFPNQLNNSLGFPGIFRGVLDVRARSITDEMALAAAAELALCAQEQGLRTDYVLPRMDEWTVPVRVAAATALKAQDQGVARLTKTRDELLKGAEASIRAARDSLDALMAAGLIASPTPP
jgi:malate dehydrogenase (oxaloacetate-decarboxylating)